MKYLLIFIVAIVALMLHKKNRAASDQLSRQRREGQRLSPPEPMHACTYCGVNVPASRCVWDAQQRPFCCAEHARKG